MTHYSNSARHVRVSFFQPSGKWKYDFQLDMGEVYDAPLIHDALEKALDADKHLGRATRVGVDDDLVSVHQPWWRTWQGPIVVLDPYHQHAHPIMLIGPVPA